MGAAVVDLMRRWTCRDTGRRCSGWRAACGRGTPNDPRITFITKALGDHTRTLHERLKAVGMPVTVEGPYGCFDFDDEKPRQIWVGAGIGITPFVARMKQLATQPGGRPSICSTPRPFASRRRSTS
jgi:hypothetical protein